MTTQQMLDEARTALHQLATGRLPAVVVDHNGERVEFTRATLPSLRAYVRELESALAGTLVTGPARVVF